jgi:hypothetical protein
MTSAAEVKIAPKKTERAWQAAFRLKGFKTRLIVGIAILTATFAYLPYFFQTIEKREGAKLADWVLSQLPPYDCSLAIFICIWSIMGLLLVRCIKSPQMMLHAIYGFVMLYMMRLLTITLIPLNPPDGLIPLIDPISNIFYGKDNFITKDLFFSGHTSSQFMAFLCLRNKAHKALALISTIIVGSLVLVQHVHYTVDVVAAIPLTYICYQLGKLVAFRGWMTQELK